MVTDGSPPFTSGSGVNMRRSVSDAQQEDQSVPARSAVAWGRVVSSLPPELLDRVPLTMALCDEGDALRRSKASNRKRWEAWQRKAELSRRHEAAENEEEAAKLQAREQSAAKNLAQRTQNTAEERAMSLHLRSQHVREVHERHRKLQGAKQQQLARDIRERESRQHHPAARANPNLSDVSTIHNESTKTQRRPLSSFGLPFSRASAATAAAAAVVVPRAPRDISLALRQAEADFIARRAESASTAGLRLREAPPRDGQAHHSGSRGDAADSDTQSTTHSERLRQVETKWAAREKKLQAFREEGEVYRAATLEARQQHAEMVLLRHDKLRSTEPRVMTRQRSPPADAPVPMRSPPSPKHNGSTVWYRVQQHLLRAEALREAREREMHSRSNVGTRVLRLWMPSVSTTGDLSRRSLP